MNKQPIEKRTPASHHLEVHSIFYTIQGEGPFCGTPAVFIRLAGCNLQCPACDTDYTSGRVNTTISAILEEVHALAVAGLVVITGGEPFRQDISRLINTLTALRYYVQVETNGTLAPPMDVQWSLMPDIRMGAYIVCSPKAGKVHSDIPKVACCYKYVIEAGNVHGEDGLPLTALQHGAHPHVARPPAGFPRPVYLQPMDAKDDALNQANLRAAIDSCMRHRYVLQLQIHKIIDME